MARTDSAAVRHFSQPVRQIITMILVCVLVAFGAYIAYPNVAPVFLANPWLNGFIAFVFVIGVFACFWQVFQLVNSVRWIEGYAADRPGHQLVRAPRLLAPLAALLRSRGSKSQQISASSSRSILDSVATRIDEARDITRYITNLLIFLGLLGTFYGLATTVPAVVDTIRSLAPQGDDTGIAVFERLMTGLESQLGGMGVAFASSLLGLAGSLVVGLLELFAGHGQNRFYRELEEWLSSITRLGLAADGEGGAEQATVAALDYMAEHMQSLRELYEAAEAGRALMDDRVERLAASVEALAARMGGPAVDDAATQEALKRIADGQARIADLLEDQADGGPSGPTALDAESRMRLRSMDVQLLRILEEMSAGRQESIADLRTDIAQLTRAIRQLGRDTSTPAPTPSRRSG
jgi:hypothetical protein